MPGVAKQAWDDLGDASTQPHQAQPPQGARRGNKPRQRLGFARRPTRQAGFPEQRAETERAIRGRACPSARSPADRAPPALSPPPKPCGQLGCCWLGCCCVPPAPSSATLPAPAASSASPTGMLRFGCRRCTGYPARLILSTASSGAAWTSSSKTPCPQVSPKMGSWDPIATGPKTTGVLQYLEPAAIPTSRAAPGGLSHLMEGDADSIPASLPGEGWACIKRDFFYRCRGFFRRAAQGGPERPRLGADIAGEPGRGVGNPTGMASARDGAPGHMRNPKLGALVPTGLSHHIGGAV